MSFGKSQDLKWIKVIEKKNLLFLLSISNCILTTLLDVMTISILIR